MVKDQITLSHIGLLTEDQTNYETPERVKQDSQLSKFQLDSKANQLIFFAFGIALLLPWNAVIAAMDYFVSIYPSYQPSFTFLLAVSIPMLLMQIVCFFMRGYLSLNISLTFALLVNGILTLLTAIIPQVIDDEKISYYVMTAIVFVFGSMIAFLQNSCYGIAGASMKLTTQLMVGVGISSLLMNILRMLFLATVNSYSAGAIVFFSISGVYLLLCCGLSIIFIKKYEAHQRVIQGSQINNSELKTRPFSMSKEGIIQRSWQVVKLNYPIGLSVVLTFTIQYTFFPGVMLTKKLDFFSSFAWFANSIITFHNLCDTLGRFLAGKYIFVSKRVFPIVCSLRIIFIVTYVLFYEGVAPGFFQNDAFVLVNLFFFSISCGYLASIGMYYGSDKESGDQGLAGSIMGFNLTLGICLGSLFANVFFAG